MSSNIEQNLNKILSSIYGKDVRQAIHDGIHDCYEDGKAGAVDLVARERIDNLVANNNPTEGNSELLDIRVGADGNTYESAGEAVRGQVGSLSKEIIDFSNVSWMLNNFSSVIPRTNYVNRAIDSITGHIGGETPTRCATENFIFLPKGSVINFSITEGYDVLSVYRYNMDRMYIDQVSKDTLKTASETSYLIRLYTGKKDTAQNISPEEAVTNIQCTMTIDIVQENIKKYVNTSVDSCEKKSKTFTEEYALKKICGKNILDIRKSVKGYIQSDGTIFETETYKTSEYIWIEKDKNISISPRIRKFLKYNSNKTPIPESLVDKLTEDYKFISQDDCYIRISYFTTEESQMMIEYSDEPTEFEPFEIIPDEKTILSMAQKGEISQLLTKYDSYYSSLYGKKWAAIGDSFTYGDFTGSQEDYIIREGKYTGKNAVYDYLIGNRNNMEIQHLAAGGRTLATPSDGSFTNCVTQDSVYKAIDSDVDYITIYIGINDSHHAPGSVGDDGEDKTGEITVGEITDSTINTFYGAWNAVMKYWIETYPFAKIGIIVSNGCDTDEYRVATIEIAKKWGIPYIDLNGDERTPMMNRSTNPNVSQESKNARNIAFRVTETNQHPNVKAHEYESYIIENFLRSL